MNCICIPFVLCFRCIVYCMPCCFKVKKHNNDPFDVQLQQNYNRRGGYFSNYFQVSTETRNTFYVDLGFQLRHKGGKERLKFVQRLARYMTSEGQVPAEFKYTWNGDEPVYECNKVPIVDANMFFILMGWKCFEQFPNETQQLYLHFQRAYQWLSKYICNNTFHEPIGASWEYTRNHSGHVLLTNVLWIQTVRSMELLACVLKDTRQENLFRNKHAAIKAKWVPNIYKTQETLPRILAIIWNHVPDDFVESFNQELQTDHVPLRTAGPEKFKATWNASIRGEADLHRTIVWPWIGFLWMIILVRKHKRTLAQVWWTKYMQYHHTPTLYSIYDKDTEPIRRAYVKAMPADSITLSMHLTARQYLHGTPV